MIDLSLAASIAEKVLLVVVGAAAARFVESRPRLVAFYGHVGDFRIAPAASDAPPMPVRTHTVVVRNAGRRAAHNVRVPHRGALEAANIHVSVDVGVHHERHTLPNGEEEIVFPTLAPRQQVTISYLYFPPLTWNVINLPITSDEGVARVLNVLPTHQFPRWVIVVLWALIAVGVATLLYGLLELYLWANATLLQKE